MISVSGKNRDEKKFNFHIADKVKIENNFSKFVARQIVSKKFNDE